MTPVYYGWIFFPFIVENNGIRREYNTSHPLVCWWRGHNIIGQRAVVDVPGQRGGNITMCAAISENGMATHIPSLGPYNSQKLLIFLGPPYTDLVPENERGLTYHTMWSCGTMWISTMARLSGPGSLPIIFTFLNPIEEFFLRLEVESVWTWAFAGDPWCFAKIAWMVQHKHKWMQTCMWKNHNLCQ